MAHKLGDVIEYVDGSCFLVGEKEVVYRISFAHQWEFTISTMTYSTLSRGVLLFNIFDAMTKALGGEYATKN